MLDRIWNKRPDGFAIKMPTKEKAGELVILEFKRMSCVTDQSLVCQTGKKRSGSPIRVHKVSTRKNT